MSDAREARDYARALDAARRYEAHLDPAVVANFRGRVWSEAGENEIASEFFKRAKELGMQNAHARRPIMGTPEVATAFPMNFYHVSEGSVKRTFRATCRTVPRRGEFVQDPEIPDRLFIVHAVTYLTEKHADAWCMVPSVHLREPTDSETLAVVAPLNF